MVEPSPWSIKQTKEGGFLIETLLWFSSQFIPSVSTIVHYIHLLHPNIWVCFSFQLCKQRYVYKEIVITVERFATTCTSIYRRFPDLGTERISKSWFYSTKKNTVSVPKFCGYIYKYIYIYEKRRGELGFVCVNRIAFF